VEELELENSSLAAAMAEKSKNVKWGAALAPTAAFLRLTDAQPYDSHFVLENYGDSPDFHYFLAVVHGKVDGVYGLKRCLPLHRRRWACLRGDFTVSHGISLPPEMIRTPGLRSVQHQLFVAGETPLAELDASYQTLLATPNPTFLTPATNGPNIAAFPLLPVHPKVACLFLGGRDIVEALQIARDLLWQIPARFVRERDILSNFFRAAARQGVADPTKSVLDCNWVHIDPSHSANLNAWFVAVLAQYGGSRSPTSPDAPCAGYDRNQPIVIHNEIAKPADGESRRSGSLPYEWRDLVPMFPLVGAPVRPDGSYTGLGEESMSPFLRELAAVRGPKANTCSFLENFRRSQLPERAQWYHFVWSAQLMKVLGEPAECTGGVKDM
jgi:hypothetical protein